MNKDAYSCAAEVIGITREQAKKAALFFGYSRDPEDEYKHQIELAMAELDRLGVPVCNTLGGSATLYGRLAALKSIQFNYQDNATPVYRKGDK